MAQKRLVAPDTPITSYPTPEVADIVITVDVDSRLPGYKVLEYGTLYPDQTRYPGAKLVAQTPLEDDRFVRRVFATDRVSQETYNYAIKFSAGEPEYPIYVRTYVELRDTYAPLADNSPDPVIPGAFLVDEEAVPADGELNSLYLKVTRIYETLPGPWVPSSRYDDDLGLVQIRRRSVANSGQVASLTENIRTTYEAREGSTGVYTELEESWSTELDGSGNSQFPVKVREFYDASRGPVRELRQLVPTTGNEVASLQNNSGVITQISYEAYNEFLSFKITQTYLVDGPQLTGFATNNEGQLITVQTQRKAASGYEAPNPTATRTVEASAEDAEAIIERVLDVPQIFDGKNITSSKEENIPSKFKAGLVTRTEQQIIEQTNVDDPLLVTEDEIEKSQQRVTEFTVRETTVSRPQNYEEIDNTRLEELWGITIPYTEAIESSVSSEENSETEGIGDGRYLVRKYDANALESKLSTFSVNIPTKINLELPKKLINVGVSYETKQSVSEQSFDSNGGVGKFTSITQRDSGAVSSTLTIVPTFDVLIEEPWGRDLDAEIHIFFLREDQLTKSQIQSKVAATGDWPKFSPRSFSTTAFGYSETKTINASISRSLSVHTDGTIGYLPTQESQTDFSQQSYAVPLDIPSCITPGLTISLSNSLQGNGNINLSYQTLYTSNGETYPGPNINQSLSHSISLSSVIYIPATPNSTTIPTQGRYIISSAVEPYKFGWYLVRTVVLDASSI